MDVTVRAHVCPVHILFDAEHVATYIHQSFVSVLRVLFLGLVACSAILCIGSPGQD